MAVPTISYWFCPGYEEGGGMSSLLKDLARAKAVFQLRAITAAMGIERCDHCQETHDDGEVFCDICGDHHEPGAVPFICQTGDGV